MQCKECKQHSEYTCKCENVGVCRSCITDHLSKSKGPHTLTEISILNSLFKCDICTLKFARLRCLCQDEKKKFCEDCIRVHLEQNMSHCVESITNAGNYRDIFKSQEKRRKLEYLSYEIRKSMENLEEFRSKVKNSRKSMISALQEAYSEASLKSQSCRDELVSALCSFSLQKTEDPNELCESILLQIDSEDLHKKDKSLNLLEASIQGEVFLKSLNSHCKVQFSGIQSL